jgi:hypothetical protein
MIMSDMELEGGMQRKQLSLYLRRLRTWESAYDCGRVPEKKTLQKMPPNPAWVHLDYLAKGTNA